MNLTGSAEIYGVIGYPIKHSLSPVFQNAAFSHLGLSAVYVPFEIHPDYLKEALYGLKLAGVKGLNVTVPHKEAVLELVDHLDQDAEKIGAVNTLKFTEGGTEGYNTDWIGFLKAIRELENPEGRRVLVLGAGGASKAVVYALVKAGAEVLIWNRTPEKAERLARTFGVRTVSRPEDVVKEVDIIVNTTSVGLREDDSPLFDYSLLSKGQAVVDLIYKETPLIKSARERGCKTQNGFPMLVYQGAESFRIWTGCEPPLKVMKRSLQPYGYI